VNRNSNVELFDGFAGCPTPYGFATVEALRVDRRSVGPRGNARYPEGESVFGEELPAFFEEKSNEGATRVTETNKGERYFHPDY